MSRLVRTGWRSATDIEIFREQDQRPDLLRPTHQQKGEIMECHEAVCLMLLTTVPPRILKCNFGVPVTG
jgi:hypothetical protein